MPEPRRSSASPTKAPGTSAAVVQGQRSASFRAFAFDASGRGPSCRRCRRRARCPGHRCRHPARCRGHRCRRRRGRAGRRGDRRRPHSACEFPRWPRPLTVSPPVRAIVSLPRRLVERRDRPRFLDLAEVVVMAAVVPVMAVVVAASVLRGGDARTAPAGRPRRAPRPAARRSAACASSSIFIGFSSCLGFGLHVLNPRRERRSRMNFGIPRGAEPLEEPPSPPLESPPPPEPDESSTTVGASVDAVESPPVEPDVGTASESSDPEEEPDESGAGPDEDEDGQGLPRSIAGPKWMRRSRQGPSRRRHRNRGRSRRVAAGPARDVPSSLPPRSPE